MYMYDKIYSVVFKLNLKTISPVEYKCCFLLSI